MSWILFFWIYLSPGRPVALSNQEFNSHAACVQAARSLQTNFGQASGFLCLEKGSSKDDLQKPKGKKK